MAKMLALALLFAAATLTSAQTAKRPMTFEDLMAMKRVSDPQISPSGKWVLFSVTDVSLEKNTKVNHLWVVPLEAGAVQPTAQKRDVGHPDVSGERQVTFGAGESNGRFSPDGKWVSYSLDGQVSIAPWDEASGTVQPPVRATQVAGGADGAIWSPDSQRLLLVASVYPECSDKPTWADEDACDKAKDEAADANPVKAQLFTALLYRHWNAFTGPKRSHVLVTDATLGNTRDLTPRSTVGDAETPTFSLGGPLGYAWAPDSREIAYVTNLDPVPAASTNNDVFTLRLDEPGAKAVKVSTSPGSDDGPQYSPDGKWLAFRSQARAGYESDRFRLMLFDRAKKTSKELMPKFDRWVDEFVWDSKSKKIYLASAEHGREVIFRYELPDSGLTEVWRGGSQAGEYSELSVSPSGSALVASCMRADDPARLVTLDLDHLSSPLVQMIVTSDRDEPRKLPSPNYPATTANPVSAKGTDLTHLNDQLLSQLALSPLTSFDFEGAAAAPVEGFLVKPPNFDPSKKYPVKFLIHGGPQGAWGDAWSYRWNPELMAASGYVVVMVNPRGSTGYGQAFIDGVNGDWGGKPYVDLMKGLDAAEQQFPFLDKDRECALGASYGGFMANWILTHTNRFKCIVTHDGMYNPAAAYGDTEELWFNEWEFRRPGDKEPAQPWRYAAGPAADDPFRKWSPMLSIQNAKTPTLVIHSQKDYRLDVSEGFQLFTALQRLGVPSEMLYFPDEGHWVLKPKNAELWNKTVSDWCDRWTKATH
jgi:dipeptidyl aminopeptidase/acylaminoacyl peptidase